MVLFDIFGDWKLEKGNMIILLNYQCQCLKLWHIHHTKLLHDFRRLGIQHTSCMGNPHDSRFMRNSYRYGMREST